MSQATDIAWAAGLFEGEGTVCFCTPKSGREFPRMALKMTDEAPVRRFASIVRLGSVNGPYKDPRAPEHHLAGFIWATQRWRDVEELFELFRPWLCQRRVAQFETVINLMSRFERGQRNAEKTHCPAGHAYDARNTYVDKKNRRSCRSCARERRRKRVK